MASIILTGTLLDPNSDLAVGDKIRFTHRTTTGETIKGAVSVETIDPSGTYTYELQYGLIMVEYLDVRSTSYKNLGVVTVNQDSTATSLPELLNAIVPPTDEQLLEFQAILADCVTARDEAEQFALDAEQSAIEAEQSAQALDSIRYSKLDNPLTHLFKKNKLVDTLDGELTWTRASNATYVDRNGVLQYAGIDEPRQEKDGWLIEGTSTNLLTSSNGTFDSLLGATVNYNASKSPDLTFNAHEMLEDATDGVHFCENTTSPLSEQRTFSVCVKRGVGSRNVRLRNGNLFYATFDFDTGDFTLTGSQVLSANFAQLSDGWYRLSITSTESREVSGFWRVHMVDEASTVYQGDGVSSVYVAFMQVESLPFASSYIPTEDSPVTRLGDTVEFQGAGNVPLLDTDNSYVFNVSPVGFTGGTPAILSTMLDTGANAFQRGFTFFGGDATSVPNYYGGSQKPSSFADESLGTVSSVVNIADDNLYAYADGTLSNTLDLSTTNLLGNVADKVTFNQSGSGGVLQSAFHLQDFRIYDFALNEAEVKFLAGE